MQAVRSFTIRAGAYNPHYLDDNQLVKSVIDVKSSNDVFLCVICDDSDYSIRIIDIACKDYSFHYRNLSDLMNARS